MGKQIDIAVLFGGNSTEHDISIVSAMHVILNLNKEKYRISSVYIDKNGKFASIEKSKDVINSLVDKFGEKIFLNDLNYQDLKEIVLKTISDKNFLLSLSNKEYDIVFPIFHGLNGEDGTVQGLLEFMKTPYVGCGVLASALSIDKVSTKLICKSKGIPVTSHYTIHKNKWKTSKKEILNYVENNFDLPLYIKPARLGSSIGIHQIVNKESLSSSVNDCLEFDDKIIVEEAVGNPREITVGVCGLKGDLQISMLGEFNNYKDDFFDFEAKYGINARKGIIPAEIPHNLEEKIKEYSRTIFDSFELSGFARLDFFLCGDNIYLNEINSIPGLETHGTFIRVWESMGIKVDDFLDRLINYGFERFEQNKNKKLNLDIEF